MPLVVKDRVKETTTTTGTGTITLAGAVTGFQAFSVIGDGNTTYYTITLSGTAEFEVGIGTYTLSGTTLSRDTILASSNGGSAVNFSAGTKDVFVTYPAERAVYTDAAGTAITPATASTLGVASGGTGAATLTANNVILGNGTSAVNFVAPGSSGNVLTSNGTTWVSAAAFASGTAMLFVQSTAPTGWTKQTTHNNKALRVVSGTAGSGGSTAFTSVFTSRTPAGSVATTTTTANTTATGSISGGSVGATTLSIAQMPSHNHTSRYSINRNINNVFDTRLSNSAENFSDSSNILNKGGSGSHTHGFTNPSFSGSAHNHTATSSSSFSGSSMDFAVQYVDVIIATKD